MLNYKFIEINKSLYAYTIQGNGIPLVLLHGFTGSSQTWGTYIEKWQDRFQVITIDLPGHGKTVTACGKSMTEFSQDLKQLLETLHLSKFHLLGYSMGGRTALSFAMEYPALIRSLILESASPGIANETDRIERRLADENLAKRIEAEGIEQFVSDWEKIALFETQRSLPEQTQEAIRQERLSQTEAGLAHSLRNMGTGTQSSWWDKISRINFPVLLIVGELDKKFVELNEKMVKLIRTAEMSIVFNAGHAVHVEQTEKFAMIVDKYIKNNT